MLGQQFSKLPSWLSWREIVWFVQSLFFKVILADKKEISISLNEISNHRCPNNMMGGLSLTFDQLIDQTETSWICLCGPNNDKQLSMSLFQTIVLSNQTISWRSQPASMSDSSLASLPHGVLSRGLVHSQLSWAGLSWRCLAPAIQDHSATLKAWLASPTSCLGTQSYLSLPTIK